MIHYNIIEDTEWGHWLIEKGYISQHFKDGEVTWEGSGRGYDKSKFNDFKGFLQKSNMFLYAEGHANAFGAGIADSKIDDFINYANKALKDFDFTPCYKVDFIYQSGDIKEKDILDIAGLKSVWGQGVGEALVAIEKVSVLSSSLRYMDGGKRPALKITLPNGMSLIKFGSSKEEYESLYSELGCVNINVVGKCEINVWNGIIKPQIIIEDYEIVDRTEYYF